MRGAFLGILAFWIWAGVGGHQGGDAVPYVTAGKLARSYPQDVYPVMDAGMSGVTPRFQAAACEVVQGDTDCADPMSPYVASPQLLPFSVLLSSALGRGGVRVMTVGSALLLAAGMWVLWRRLAHRAEHARYALVMAAVLTSPIAMYTLLLGQTSPVMFLSVCLGISFASKRGRVASGVAWATASLLKVFPAALVLIAGARRRRGVIVVGASTMLVVTLVSVVLLPGSLWGRFVKELIGVGSSVNPGSNDASLRAGIIRLMDAMGGSAAVASVISLGVAIVFAVSGLRRGSDDSKWAVGYVALLLASPMVWNYYLLVLVGATGVVLADRSPLGRELYLLPVVGFVVSVPMLLNGVFAESVWVASQPICLLVGAAIVLWILHLPGSTESAADAAPEPQRSW